VAPAEGAQVVERRRPAARPWHDVVAVDPAIRAAREPTAAIPKPKRATQQRRDRPPPAGTSRTFPRESSITSTTLASQRSRSVTAGASAVPSSSVPVASGWSSVAPCDFRVSWRRVYSAYRTGWCGGQLPVIDDSCNGAPVRVEPDDEQVRDRNQVPRENLSRADCEKSRRRRRVASSARARGCPGPSVSIGDAMRNRGFGLTGDSRVT
jgi:hypothetical protein